jgi:hypothetical protein
MISRPASTTDGARYPGSKPIGPDDGQAFSAPPRIEPAGALQPTCTRREDRTKWDPLLGNDFSAQSGSSKSLHG